MPNRILRDWTDSFRVADLSAEAERFFTRLIMKADDFGRFHGDDRLLKAALFPLLTDICPSSVRQWLAECQQADLLTLYKDPRGRKFLEIKGFNQRTRAKDSKFPSSDGHMTVICQTHAHGDGDGDGDGDVTLIPEDREPETKGFSPDWLEEIWKATTPAGRNRSTRKQVQAAWKKSKPKPTRETALGALEAWSKSEKWKNGFAEGLHRWIDNRGWESLPEAETKTQNGATRTIL